MEGLNQSLNGFSEVPCKVIETKAFALRAAFIRDSWSVEGMERE